MAINTTSVAHIRLTVTDIERSRQFYESVFGWTVFIELPEGADEATRQTLSFLYGGVIYDLGGALLGLRPVASDRFDEDRVGLDHLAFRLVSKTNWAPRQLISTQSESSTSRARTSDRPTSWSSAIRTTSRWN